LLKLNRLKLTAKESKVRSRWIKQQAECNFIFNDGGLYPVAVHCVVFENNQFGEKRFYDAKNFKLREIKR